MAKLILEDNITSYTTNLEEVPIISEVVEAFIYGCKALSYTDENIYNSLKNVIKFYEENNKVVD